MAPSLQTAQPLLPHRQATQAKKDALWSFHFHGAGLELQAVPADLRPLDLTHSMEIGRTWEDEHARDRRLLSLRRLNRAFLSGLEDDKEGKLLFKEPDTAGKRIAQALNDQAGDYGRVFRTDVNVTVDFARQVGSEVIENTPDSTKCIPLVDDPDFDPVRGQTFLFSKMLVLRELDYDLTCLLDPRCWDNCSDLFDDTCRVEMIAGNYVRINADVDPIPIGTPWKGLLYENAGVGPQTLENILDITFEVTRTCSDQPKRPAACRAGVCNHLITKVNVDYGLYDCLSYRIGAIELPGPMRQNQGYFRATRSEDGITEISCEKTVRFGRVSNWGVGPGAFDFGEILNYTAPTLLSLWIYDVTQIVPCCKYVKKATDTPGQQASTRGQQASYRRRQASDTKKTTKYDKKKR